ncbi:MAG: serine protease, partial [Parafilimonas sp.]
SKPEIDQMVAKHKLFLSQMENYADNFKLKQSLHHVHARLIEKGEINESQEPISAKGKVVRLYRKYKRVTAIAASIAGVTALVISALVTYFTPAPINKNDLQQLYHQLNQVQKSDKAQNYKLKEIDSKIPIGSTVTAGGTAFLIDGKGYLVTNAHVLKGSGAVVVSNTGQEFNARICEVDLIKDLAILKIEDKDFTPFKSLPYGIKKSGAELGEELFTLGYPRNEIVYNMGYLSAESGHDGDTSSFQISLSANPGNSGGPVFNKNGEIVGILSTRQTQAEGVVFATRAKNIFSLLDELKETDTAVQKMKLPSSSAIKSLDRVSQIKQAENYVYQVKAYNQN